ncbi:MAG: diguanylate cyclase [Pseudomonadota bacterium]
MQTSGLPPVAPRRDAAILIVDDAPANVSVLRKMMVQQGYQTFVANSGERALQIARRVHPDLILLDVVMPDMDGFETCRRLKAYAGTARIPVIFMSARTDTDDIVAGLDIGAVDYIGKPLHMAEVCARVRTQLQIRSHSDSQQEQADRLRTIVNSLGEGLMIIEANGRIQFSNPACDQALGYDRAMLAGRHLSELLAPAPVQEYLAYFSAYAANPDTPPPGGVREAQLRLYGGGVRAMDMSVTPMLAREPLFIALLHDITHHKQSETALQHAALVDPLTRIANRRHFDSFLEKEWQRAMRNVAPLSLVVLDVDHFKLYNDTLGHPEGDTCLQEVAATIAAHALRPTDLAARYGGEEFVLLFADTPADAAAGLAESIRSHIESLHLPHPRSPTSAWITVSVGVATIVPTQLDTLEKLLVAADRAMYSAKEGGRNRVEAVDSGNAAWEAVKALIM